MRHVFAIAGALSLTIGHAFAEPSGNYINVQDDLALVSGLGISRSGTEARTGNATRGVYGYDFGNGFKTEIERLEYSATVPGPSLTPAGGVRSTTLMLNGLYEFRNGGWRLKPYVAVGFGTTDFSARLLRDTQNSFTPTYQVKGGVNYNISAKLLGKMEYNWSQGNGPSLGLSGIPAKFKLKRGGFVVGVNYKLN